jgi:hypothetical protein
MVGRRESLELGGLLPAGGGRSEREAQRTRLGIPRALRRKGLLPQALAALKGSWECGTTRAPISIFIFEHGI